MSEYNPTLAIPRTTLQLTVDWLPTWKKSRLNWKLKVSNAAWHHAVAACETRYRRMQN